MWFDFGVGILMIVGLTLLTLFGLYWSGRGVWAVGRRIPIAKIRFYTLLTYDLMRGIREVR